VFGELLGAAPEEAYVRVPEAVDGLARVAHGEQPPVGDQLDERELQRVGVLELVHQHLREALGVASADVGVVPQERMGGVLEVVEVERAARPLGGGVGVAERGEQEAEERIGLDRAGVDFPLDVRGQRLPVGDARRPGERAVAARQRERAESPQTVCAG
jgi:hypothetical protein